jgi:protein-disulfide isomerase
MIRVPIAFVALGTVALLACQKQSESRRSEAGATLSASGGDPLRPRLDPNKVVLTWDQGPMTYGDLRKKKEAQYKKLYNKYMGDMFSMEQQELEGYVIQTLVEKKAKDAGKSPDEYVQSLVPPQTVTDQEMQEFYDKKLKQSGQPFELLKDRIGPYLEGEKRQKAMREAFEKLKAEAHVKIDLPQPEMSAITFDLAGRPMKGNPNAKVTIVEFSDFECPYCSRAVDEVEAVLKAYPKEVKLYYLHFPLTSIHKTAMPAAIAAECAGQQDKFWPFHDKLFQNQSSLRDDFFKTTAKDLGLDESKFVACLENPATKDRVKQDQDQGNAAGVEGTPSFYINGSQYPQGIPSVDAVKAYVERASAN